MRSNLKLLKLEFQKIIPLEARDMNLKSSDMSRFWSLFDNFVREVKQEYVKKIPEGGSPSDNIVRAMAIGRIAALEEILGEKPVQT